MEKNLFGAAPKTNLAYRNKNKKTLARSLPKMIDNSVA